MPLSHKPGVGGIIRRPRYNGALMASSPSIFQSIRPPRNAMNQASTGRTLNGVTLEAILNQLVQDHGW